MFILVTVDDGDIDVEKFDTHKEAFQTMLKSIKNIHGLSEADWNRIKNTEAHQRFSFGFTQNEAWMGWPRNIMWKICEV